MRTTSITTYASIAWLVVFLVSAIWCFAICKDEVCQFNVVVVMSVMGSLILVIQCVFLCRKCVEEAARDQAVARVVVLDAEDALPVAVRETLRPPNHVSIRGGSNIVGARIGVL